MGETGETGDESLPDDPLTVGQLNDRIDEVVDSATGLHGVRCMGEVVDMSERDTAVYFTLTDGEHDLPCVVWQSRYRNMSIDLEDGMKVVLEGNVDFYVEGGKISLKPWEVTAVGEGNQAAASPTSRTNSNSAGDSTTTASRLHRGPRNAPASSHPPRATPATTSRPRSTARILPWISSSRTPACRVTVLHGRLPTAFTT